METKLLKSTDGYRIIFKDGETFYAPLELKDVDAAFIGDIIVSSKTNKSKAFKTFEAACDTLDVDIPAAISVIRHDFKEFMAIAEEKKPVAPPRMEGTTMETIAPTPLEELCMIAAVCARQAVSNPPWLLIIGAPSSGKTRSLKLINDDELCSWESKVTLNALIPGRPSTDAETVKGVLENSDRKCMVFNEASVFFSGNKDNIDRNIAQMTDAFDGSIAIDDGGGHRNVQCRFVALWGMTWLKYKQNLAKMADFGLRFLVFLYPTPETIHKNDDKFEERKFMVVSHVKNNFDKKMPALPPEVDEELSSLVDKICILRSLTWANAMEKREGSSRLYQQLSHIIRARALLWNREPDTGDVDFASSFAVSSIPHVDDIVNLLSDPTSFLYHNAEGIGLIKDGAWTDDWGTFIDEKVAISELMQMVKHS